MDPPPSSPAPSSSSRDGPMEEDGQPVLVEMAKEAATLFQTRRFAECADVLNQLLQKKKDDKKEDKKGYDPKVIHNIALAEYFRDSCSDPKKLLHVLDEAKTKSKDFARTSGEEMEVASSLGSNIISGSRGSNTTQLQLSAANTGNVAYADEFDSTVLMFNIAVICYHLHEYARALSILWPLYQNIAPIDEPMARHVCLLLLDIALASQDAPKAADVIQYLEKSYMTNQGDNGSIAQHQSSNHGLKISAVTSNIAAQDASSSDSSASANVSENPLVGTSSDDALEFENLYSTLDSGGQNLGRPALNDPSRTSADLKLKIHLYKVRLLLLTRNLKAAKREVKLAMNDARGRDSSTELVLKSQLEYCRGNHNKAIKQLQASRNRTEPAMQIIFNNNLGCIYHQLGNYHESLSLFTNALKISLRLLSEKPWNLSTYSQNKSRHIVYNCGLLSLICGNPLAAAHSFHQAFPIFDKRPLFWLRSAECCLLAFKKGLLRSGGAYEEIKVHVVGSGRWRQLVIDDSNLRNGYLDSTAQVGSLSSDKKGTQISLPFARQCLHNALLLLDNAETKTAKYGSSVSALEENQATPVGVKNSNHKSAPVGDSKASNVTSFTPANVSDDSKEMKDGQSSNTTLQSSVAAYAETCREENHMIKQAVLGDLAFVDLCLDDPHRALRAAKSLQELPDCSRMYIFLSRVYAAEALCHLNRLQEAMEQLSVYITDGGIVELPYSDEDTHKWSTVKFGDGEESKASGTVKTTVDEPQDWVSLKPEEARGALYANFSAMCAMQGDLEQAGLFAKEALSSLPNNPRATLAAVFVDLKQGKAQDALVKLRESRHVRFLPTGVKLSS